MKIYMIGIKGVGMTMLAQYYAAKGFQVSGSDTAEKYMTDEVLAKNKISVIESFSAANIPDDADLIVYSTAYSAERNEEVAAAISGRIKTLTYAEALADIFNKGYGIAVAGSHGKTTTTAWLGYVLDKAGKSPSVMVGANVPQFGGTSLSGKADYIVIEADEYQNKLKYFSPQAVLLNNIDYDHPDFFPTEDEYQKVFIEFIKKIPKNGFLVTNFDDVVIRRIANVNCRARVISYAIDETADYVAYDLREQDGRQYFKVKLSADDYDEEEYVDSGELGDFSVQLAGRHNIYNALAVIASAIELGVDLSLVRTYLEEFAGTTRRMQVMGEYKGAIIIDDYAHHPTEVKTTLSAIRQKYKDKKITVVFHPHTYTRTKALLNDFAQSFREADNLVVLDIYGSAREKQGGVHSRDLIAKIEAGKSADKPNGQILYIPDLAACEKYLKENAGRDDIIVLMGAGDVFRIGENLIK